MNEQPTPSPVKGPRRAGPTDYTDPELRHEVKRAAVWVGVAGAAVLVVFLAEPLLVIFAGMVLAAAIDGGARLIGRVLNVPRSWRVAMVLVAIGLFLAWVAVFAGNMIVYQASLLPEIVVKQALKAVTWLKSHRVAIDPKSAQGLIEQAANSIDKITSAVGGFIGTITTLILIVVLGIYIAAEPRLYQRGVAWMLPMHERENFHATAAEMANALRRLMFGRLLAMLIEGIATTLALAAYGVPMASLLGLLTGMLAFLPNIGAPISGSIMIMVGFSGSTSMGVYCIIVYLVLHTIDGNLIAPYIARKTVDLAPALVLGAQLVMGSLFGLLGLALADPLVAMIKIGLERRSQRHEAEWHAAHPESAPG